ncbi:MAG: hypothetical protein JWN70_5557 [Planctomycetaceae bacterium]|nr:hypothetical protein [Planctomycetaceae bacterium]
MTDRLCPHCQFQLPELVGAFCPECGERWDEPPMSADATQGGSGSSGSGFLEILRIFALLGVAGRVMNDIKNDEILEAIGITGFGILFVLFGPEVFRRIFSTDSASSDTKQIT